MPIIFGCISRNDKLKDIEDPIINTAKKLYNSSLEVIEPQINTIIGYSNENNIITSNTNGKTAITYTNTPKALDSDSTQITLTTSKIEITVDHFNTKRVYFYQDESYIAFSTSLRHLVKTMEKLGLKIKLNHKATMFYLATGIPPIKDTLINGFTKTAPGEKVIIKTDNQEKRSIHRDFINYEKPPNLTEKYLEKIYECMKEAVRKRVENDEKPAIMLSGGIDSTLLAALITRYNENLTAINLEIPNFYSEYEVAYKIAEHLNISLIKLELKMNKEEVLKKYLEVLSYIEEPTSRAAFMNHYEIIRELQRRNHKEVYAGLGGAIISIERTKPNKFNWDKEPLVRIFKNKAMQKTVNILCKMREAKIKIPRKLIEKAIKGYILGQGKSSFEGFILGTYLDNYFNNNIKTINTATKIIASELKHISGKLEKMAENDKLNAKGLSTLPRLINFDVMTIGNISSKLNLKLKMPYLDVNLMSTIYRIPSKLKYHMKINKYILIKIAERYKLLPRNYIKEVKKKGMKQIVNPLVKNRETLNKIYSEIREKLEESYLKRLILKELKSRNRISKIRIAYLWLWLKTIW